jgi:hypothetical protein
MMYCWAALAIAMLWLFARQKFWLSPTAIFLGYSALMYPISYLVSWWLQVPSLFFASPRQIAPQKADYAFCLICLHVACFCVARFLIPVPRLAFFAPLPRMRWPEIRIIGSRLGLALAAALLAAAFAALFFLRRFDGIQGMIANLGDIRGGALSGMGVEVYALTYLVPKVMQFWLIYALKTHAKHTRFILLATLGSSLFGGLLGFRSPVAIFLVETGCIWFLLTGRLSRKRLSGFALLALIAAILTGVTREVSSILGGNAELIATVPLSTLGPLIADSIITRERGIEVLVLMTDFVDREGESHYHYFAENVVDTLLSIVPSFVVAGIPALTALKSYPLCTRITTAVYGGSLLQAGNVQDAYGGVGFGLVSAGYWCLGSFGVALTSSLLGYLLRILEGGRAATGLLYLMLYKSVAGSMFVLIEAQGGINQICINLFVALLILGALSLGGGLFSAMLLPLMPGRPDAEARG